MPTAPMRMCLQSGCSERVQRGRCEKHQQQERKHGRRFNRGETAYNRARWMHLRDAFRAEHPLCVNAGKQGCTMVTRVVDHKIPHRGDDKLMYDVENLQGMCWECHSRKTAFEVGFVAPKA